MKDDFDKRLSDRIAEVFDNYEDRSADAGWALLREKYPEKKKRRGVIWLWIGSAAAVLLLFLGIWIWNDHVNPKANVVTTEIAHKTVTDTTASANGTHLAAAKLNVIEQDSVHIKAQAAIRTPVEFRGSSPRSQNHVATTSSKTKNQLIQNSTVQPNTTTLGRKNAATKFKTQTIAANTGGKQASVVPPGNSSNVAQRQTPIVVNEPAKTQGAQNSVQQAVAINKDVKANGSADTLAKKNIAQNEAKPAKPIVKSPFSENDPVIKKDKSEDKTNNSNKVTFGVYAATYLNYASGSSGQVNIGAGVASDIPVAKNLKLSAGLAVNQNSLNYGNHLPPTNGLDFAAASAPMRSFYSLVAPTALTTAATYPFVLKNYNAQLTSLDIPLNLKYEFNPQKNSSFVSLGLSSGTFITEAYNAQYNNAFSATQTQTTSTTNSFSGFAIAKTLDFSFGLGYPIGKNNLSIEPFVKYPLQGLGADQIRFGAGGLNLKFNFSNNKK